MDKWNQLIEQEKMSIQEIKAPKELKSRLNRALIIKRQRKNINWFILAATCLLIFAIGTQYNVVAYYGKKLVGFEQLTNDTLFMLNEKESTQIIDQTYTFHDGATFTIEGIMTDANQSIVYFHYNVPNEDDLRIGTLKGFLTKPDGYSGSTMQTEENLEVKGIYHYQAVNPLARKLTLNVTYKNEEYDLTFDYDANKALATYLKKTMNETVELNGTKVTFHNLVATPTMTMIKGKKSKYKELQHENIYLLVNGEKYEMQTGSETSGLFNDTFTIGFDALPERIESLQLYIGDYVTYTAVNQSFPIDSPINLGGEEVQINEVQQITDQTVGITITTKEDIVLNGVYALNEQGEHELLQTIDYEHISKGDQSLLRRTLIFDMSELPTDLQIIGFESLIDYDFTKEIKIN